MFLEARGSVCTLPSSALPKVLGVESGSIGKESRRRHPIKRGKTRRWRVVLSIVCTMDGSSVFQYPIYYLIHSHHLHTRGITDKGTSHNWLNNDTILHLEPAWSASKGSPRKNKYSKQDQQKTIPHHSLPFQLSGTPLKCNVKIKLIRLH
jgi:hypothetical protein